MSIKHKLQAWHKLEYLTPHTVEHGEETILIRSETDLPWLYPEKYELLETDKHTYRHQVLIGVFDIEEMMQLVRKVFHDEDINSQYNDYKVKSVFAEITVEHSGSYRSGSFKVSTMPFALGKLEQTGPGQYEAWNQSFKEIELELQNTIAKHLRNRISLHALNDLLNSLIEKMQWSPRFRKCRFWSIPQKVLKPKFDESSESQPEEKSDVPGILNSFYLRDLELIMQTVEEANSPVGQGLGDYLTGERISNSERLNIDGNREKLTQILSPRHIPLGKWPGNDEHTLNLMQQAAVNQIFMKLSDKPGLFSVNGPPGTGKTTLLRDAIAAIVVERAKKLMEYDKPNEAFTYKKNIGSSPIHTLDPKLCGYGIVISSSNNGAVENISKELPEIFSVDSRYHHHEGAAYFRDVAQTVGGENNWGLISAALGNSGNRFKFFSKLWYKPKEDPGTSLKNVLFQAKDSRKNKHGVDVIKNWHQARESFASALQEVLSEQSIAAQAYANVLKQTGMQRRIKLLAEAMTELKNAVVVEEGRLQLVLDELRDFQGKLDSKQQQLAFLQGMRFGLLDIVFRWREYRDARRQRNRLLLECSELQAAKHDKAEQERLYRNKINSLNKSIAAYKTKVDKWQRRFNDIQQKLKHERTENKRIIMDDDFWNQPAAVIQKSSPWVTLQYTQARSRLFLEALNLHESFIMAAASQIIGNLYAAAKLSSVDPHADREAIPAIWDVFTLVVPVISSTFASISSMFKGMEAQSLGWVFIDEAGQAVPQAAIGAMWRARKTVVVGDPLQIEPVVTLPKVVLQDVARYYDVSDRFISLSSSVQTVADLANRNGTYIQGKWIGSPLWVHRRCISPMFEICNEIAYEGRMVLDTSKPDLRTLERIERLGPNAWIQVEGESTVKQFVPEQAKAVLRLIRKAFEPHRSGGMVQPPSLYVISPFAAVKQQLKEMLRGAHGTIAPLTTKKDFNKWINQSIGTVHTFQGKQADAVIFCLGVDADKSGAADWATSSVNLINVAVSRAKYRFIVVGDKQVWAPKEFMSNVYRYLEDF